MNLDFLREKLARQYNPVVTVHIHDQNDMTNNQLVSMYMEDAIRKYDPFQNRG